MAFNPKQYVIKVQGNREYLPVSARLIWFRSEHPDWGIVTTPVEINLEKQYAIFSASIFNADGKLMATATKMENVKGFGDYLEKSECVPLSTRILTLEGWKTHDELRLGETVAAYNAQTDVLEWVPLLAVQTYENVPVVRMSNKKGFDVVCTPDHKWATRYSVNSNGKRYEYRRLQETARLTTADAITTAALAPAAAAVLPVTPEQAFVMGMLITDGSLRYDGKQVRGYICQAKPEGVAVIRERLARVPHREDVVPAHTRTFPTGRTYDCRTGYRWHPSANYLHDLHDAFGIVHETELPRVAGRLSTEARAALLEAMTLAEGDKKGNWAQMPGRNDWVIDLWTYLCALEGSQVCRSVVRESCGGIWTALRKKTRQVWASNVRIEDAGRLDVWCPQTPLGTWVARFDNDVVTVTGNTGAVGRALAYCGYGTQFAPELEEGTRIADTPRGGLYAGNGGNANGPNNRFAGSNSGAMSSRPPAPPLASAPQRPAPAPAPVDDERDFPGEPEDAFGDEPAAPASRPVAARHASATPPPARPPAPAATAAVTRVKEPEQDDFDPGGQDEDDEDPFAEDDGATAAPVAPPRAPARLAPTTAAGGNRCSVEGCPATLLPSQITMSTTKFGKPLCPLHQRDAAPLASGGGASTAPRRAGGKPEPADSLL